jgi:hypothetical protein
LPVEHAAGGRVDLVWKRIEIRGLDGDKRIEHPEGLAFCSNYLASEVDAVREFEAGGLSMGQRGRHPTRPRVDHQRRASLRVEA